MTFDEFPQSNQLFQRDTGTNQALIAINGHADTSVISIRIRLYRNENIYFQSDFSVDTIQGHFNFSVTIDAELADYRIEASAILTTEEEVHLNTVNNVLAGDVYLIMGQSNAKAAFPYTGNHPYLRSFSVSQGWTSTFAEYGIWGKEIAERIANQNQIPVLFFNTAVSSSTITENGPNATIFQHTMRLLDSANVLDHITGFFWFQGESDAGLGNDASYYKNAFQQFDAALNQSIPQIDNKYLIQIRNSCWANEPNGSVIQEAQRQLVDSLPSYSILGTQGLQHDGCHFTGAGYMTLAEQLYGVLARDVYGVSDVPNIDAPLIEKAIRTDTNEIILITRDSTDKLEWIGAAETEFFLINAENSTIIGGFSYQNKVVLTTSGVLPNGAFISYTGHAGGEDTLPVVRNARGLGLIAFHNFAIENPLQTLEICNNGIDDDGNGFIDLEDSYCDCNTNPTVTCPSFDCSTLLISNLDGRILLEHTEASIFAVQIYDSNWQLLADTIYHNTSSTQLLMDVGAGHFNIIAKAFEANWTLLCERYFDITIPQSFDCSFITFDTLDSKIKVAGLNSPIASVLIFDSDWDILFTFFDFPLNEEVLSDVLAPGNYYVKASLVSDTWEDICSSLQSIHIQNQPVTLDCSDIVFNHKNTEFVISDLSTNEKSIQVWDASWNLLFSCFSPNCPLNSVSIPLSTAGDVYAKVNYFQTNWTELCGREEFVSNSAFTFQKTFKEGVVFEKDTVLLSGIALYPNPIATSFTVFVPENEQEILEFHLLNAHGKVEMKKMRSTSEHYTFNVQHLKKGMYWLKTQGEGRTRIYPISILE